MIRRRDEAQKGVAYTLAGISRSGRGSLRASSGSLERLTRISLLAATAIVLGYIETMIPLPVSVPGIKLGLANAAVLVALFSFDTRSACSVAVIKVIATGFLFGSPAMLAYSAGGMACAIFGMVLLKQIPRIDIVPVSMVSAILHNVGQLAVAALFLQTPAVFINLPLLAVAACITGAVIGVASKGAVKSIKTLPDLCPEVSVEGFSWQPGEVIAFIGANGSGKTTFARSLARRFRGAGKMPGGGTFDDADRLTCARCGIVLQNPDDQIVAPVVFDDVAFGLENHGVPTDEMKPQVLSALEQAGASDLFSRAVESLSGGQKQRVAVAGLITLLPGLMIFDESTSMLDPSAREEFSCMVDDFKARGIAVIIITQSMEEAFKADRICVFSGGNIVAEETPDTLLGKEAFLREQHLGLPPVAKLASELRSCGYDIPLTNNGRVLEEEMWRLSVTT